MDSFEDDDADAWPDEPDEFDPDSIGPDPPASPGVTTDETDVDEQTFRSFWGAVVMANVGLFCSSLGLMLWYFRGQAVVGLALIVVGFGSLARTYITYRRYLDRGET